MSRDSNQKGSLLDRVAVLAIMGLLAGAIGGFGIGIVTQKSASTTPSTSSAPPSK
ncbi:MAG: hypothetical protein ACLPHP_11575 [Candidatus Sulfotelmatobacter sp.]